MMQALIRSLLLFGAATFVLSALPREARAATPGCGQAQVEALWGAPPPPAPSLHYIYPRQPVTPFYQWENNDGYCGETSLMIGGLMNGQWMSQFNARLICGAFFGPESNRGGASLLQAGSTLAGFSNYNAQLLIENPDTGVSGPYDFAHASLCAANSRLRAQTYPYTTGYHQPNLGMAGYRDYMSWVKSQVIAGNQVTVAVYFHGGGDAQYDHEVSVTRIGTNHDPNDATYYPDDVLYFDDHGAYTLVNVNGQWKFAENPSVPLGAGRDDGGCTPYLFGYTFASLANTREAANLDGAPGYSIAIPANEDIVTGSGNTGPDGGEVSAIKGPHNYGFAVAGPLDNQDVTLPVLVTILRAESQSNGIWAANPWDHNSSPAAGNNYETPYIGGPVGTCNDGSCVSNAQPAPMLVQLQATVSGLTAGSTYNLYEYEFPSLTGADVGAAAALAVPDENFNANAKLATAVTHITASGSTYTSSPLSVGSDRIVVFRAVPSWAP
jgi:hypothetical protein